MTLPQAVFSARIHDMSPTRAAANLRWPTPWRKPRRGPARWQPQNVAHMTLLIVKQNGYLRETQSGGPVPTDHE